MAQWSARLSFPLTITLEAGLVHVGLNTRAHTLSGSLHPLRRRHSTVRSCVNVAADQKFEADVQDKVSFDCRFLLTSLG